VLDVGTRGGLARGATRWPHARLLVVGLAMGLGFLCKYSAAYQICAGQSSSRFGQQRGFTPRKPGPWLALLIFAVCHLARHHLELAARWITIPMSPASRFADRMETDAALLLDFLSTEALLLNPIFPRRDLRDDPAAGNGGRNVPCGFFFSA